MHAQLGQDVLDVGANRPRRDQECTGDLVRGPALDQETKDLSLTQRQAEIDVARRVAALVRRESPHCADVLLDTVQLLQSTCGIQLLPLVPELADDRGQRRESRI